MADAPTFACSVCGAPAQSGDFSCRYCGAGIATLCCSRCFHMNMAHAQHCSGCGCELGMLVESELRDAHCSDCHERLAAIQGAAGSLLGCQHCGGRFVEHALFRSMMERAESAGFAIPDALYQRPEAKAALERVHYRPCAVCQQMMNRRNFGGASGVIVDVCAKHGTWFDAGELPQVLAFIQSGGLVRERTRELERKRLTRAHEREHASTGAESSTVALAASVSGGERDHGHFAADLLTFVLEVLSGNERKTH